MKHLLGVIGISALAFAACGKETASSPSRGGSAGITHQGDGGVADNAGTTGAGAKAGNTTDAGSAGSSGSGAGVTASQSDGGASGSPSVDDDGDPKPAEPDLTGLVPTSSKWLLVTMPPPKGGSLSADLELLDLATNALHPANPKGPTVAGRSLSPNGSTYFFSDSDGTRVSSRYVRLTENGFVPAKSFVDYGNVVGAMGVLSWTFDSRFALVSKGGGPSGIEVIDVVLGKRLHHEALSGHVGSFSPNGYDYFYDASQDKGYEPRFARLTAAGNSEVMRLPPDADHMTFDLRGAWLLYTLGIYPEPMTLHAVALDDFEHREVMAVGAGEKLEFPLFPVAGDSVVVGIRRSNTEKFLRRISFWDETKPPVTISSSAASLEALPSKDGKLVLELEFATNTLSLVSLDSLVSSPIPAKQVPSKDFTPYGFAGKYAYDNAADGLHLASLNAANVLTDTIVSSPGKATRPCAASFLYTPSTRFAFIEGNSEKLVFVDLTANPPAVVGSITPSDGYMIACPLWGDSDTVVAVTEFIEGNTSRNAWIMPWKTPGAPSAPQLVAHGVYSVEAAMYR